LIDLPDKANKPTKISSLSSSTSLAFSWIGNTDYALPGGKVSGYKIYMDNGLNGDFVEIYYGKNVPNIREYIATRLEPQRPYRIRIQAENFNGFEISQTFQQCILVWSLQTLTHQDSSQAPQLQ
jgi:hypothetical protein